MFSNVPGVISVISLLFIDNCVNFGSPLNASTSIFVILQKSAIIICSWSDPFERKFSFAKIGILLPLSMSCPVCLGMIEGILFNPESEQFTLYPSLSHLHSSGHCIATLVGSVTNHNQNIITGVANSNDTNTTVSLDGMAMFCNLHTERETVVERYCA